MRVLSELACGRAFLFSPVSMVCVALLVLNDHCLKGLAAGTGLSVLTGKLSDFAGVVVLMGVVDWLVGLTVLTRRFAPVAAAVGAVLALILLELSPEFVGAYVSLHDRLFAWAGLPWQSRLVMDPTDLFALVMVVPGWKWCQEYRQEVVS